MDHDVAGGMLRSLRELTDGYVPPPMACNTWRALWAEGDVILSAEKTPAAKREPEACYDRHALSVSASITHTGPFVSYGQGKWMGKDGGSPDDAINGDIYTFWSTGRPQQGGEWFAIDMGSSQPVSRIELETHRLKPTWGAPTA